uniref:Cytoskeleton associated protein 2-like n=1 Tax=Lates calcarifer TaxID=8187 RepID=A0A4W6FJG4_LATCA
MWYRCIPISNNAHCHVCFIWGKLIQQVLLLRPYLRDDCLKPVVSARKVAEGKENKAPIDRLRYEGSKGQTLPAQPTKHPSTRAFRVTNKENVRVGVLTGQQNAKHTCSTRGPTQLEVKPNPPRVHTTVSSKYKVNVASHLKKQPNTAANTRENSSSKAFSSSTKKTLNSVRMSLGPIVKTKTGLIPAVTQPKNTQSHLIHSTATATGSTTTPSVTNKVRPSTSSVSVSQKSATAQRKTLATAAVNNLVNERKTIPTARAGIKDQDQSKSGSKSLLVKNPQPSCKSQLMSGQKSVSMSKYTTAPIKLEGRGVLKTNKLAGVATGRSTKQKLEGGGEKNGQPRTVPTRTSSGLASRAASGVTRAAVAELGGKTKICNETQSKRVHSSANALPPQVSIRRAGAPVMSHTVPRPVRTISHTGNAADVKTPKVPVRVIPQTEGKKLTAAQEERMRKLQEWREAKGISYKRPPMPVKPQVRRTVAVPQPFWTTMTEEDEAHSLICAVDRSLADCIKLLGEGCPQDQVREVLSRLPAVSQKFAKYWICQARLMEKEGNLDVLPMFEEAVRVVLEPVDELRAVVFEILKKKDEIQESEAKETKKDQSPAVESSPESSNNPMMTPKPVRALICGEKGDSSVVKYKITATPGGPPSQQRDPARVNGQEVRFFTPVRRSVRIERASLRYPASLQDHDLCVASYNDLISEEDKEESEEREGGETSPAVKDTPLYVYRENEALKDKMFVELVCD